MIEPRRRRKESGREKRRKKKKKKKKEKKQDRKTRGERPESKNTYNGCSYYPNHRPCQVCQLWFFDSQCVGRGMGVDALSWEQPHSGDSSF
jgi:hypothetical protein